MSDDEEGIDLEPLITVCVVAIIVLVLISGLWYAYNLYRHHDELQPFLKVCAENPEVRFYDKCTGTSTECINKCAERLLSEVR